MRSRGESSAEVYTAVSMAQQFGVMKGSYEAAPLPADVTVQQVQNGGGGGNDFVYSTTEILSTQCCADRTLLNEFALKYPHDTVEHAYAKESQVACGSVVLEDFH